MHLSSPFLSSTSLNPFPAPVLPIITDERDRPERRSEARVQRRFKNVQSEMAALCNRAREKVELKQNAADKTWGFWVPAYVIREKKGCPSLGRRYRVIESGSECIATAHTLDKLTQPDLAGVQAVGYYDGVQEFSLNLKKSNFGSLPPNFHSIVATFPRNDKDIFAQAERVPPEVMDRGRRTGTVGANEFRASLDGEFLGLNFLKGLFGLNHITSTALTNYLVSRLQVVSHLTGATLSEITVSFGYQPAKYPEGGMLPVHREPGGINTIEASENIRGGQVGLVRSAENIDQIGFEDPNLFLVPAGSLLIYRVGPGNPHAGLHVNNSLVSRDEDGNITPQGGFGFTFRAPLAKAANG